jgi:CRP-like cAMP-binding protein
MRDLVPSFGARSTVNLRSGLRVNRPNAHFERSINVPEIRPNQNLLSALPEHLSADLFTNTTPVQLAADEVLFMAGDAGDGCYLVEDGLLKVTMVSRSGTERILAFLGRSAIVGELSMIDGRPRSASVVAIRETALSFLSRGAFEGFAFVDLGMYFCAANEAAIRRALESAGIDFIQENKTGEGVRFRKPRRASRK